MEAYFVYCFTSREDDPGYRVEVLGIFFEEETASTYARLWDEQHKSRDKDDPDDWNDGYSKSNVVSKFLGVPWDKQEREFPFPKDEEWF